MGRLVPCGTSFRLVCSCNKPWPACHTRQARFGRCYHTYDGAPNQTMHIPNAILIVVFLVKAGPIGGAVPLCGMTRRVPPLLAEPHIALSPATPFPPRLGWGCTLALASPAPVGWSQIDARLDREVAGIL